MNDKVTIIDISKDDSEAFIFTLKNPHGVPPTRFMKRKESDCTIYCNPNNGPIFGNENGDILITDNCNEKNSWISSPSCLQYEYHTEYQSSLFVDSGGPNEENSFIVSDYEVYTASPSLCHTM